MTLNIDNATVTITNTEPDQEVIFQYLAGSGKVRIHMVDQGYNMSSGVVYDMGFLIQALAAIKNTQDNERRRMR